MPPIPKYSKEDILKCAYGIVEKEGFSKLNARRIAKTLGCSVQPIFHNFTSMEELIKEVYNNIYKLYEKTLLEAANSNEQSYKQTGLAYIRFAAFHSEFFKIIFMKQTNMNADTFMASGSLTDDIIETGRKFTGLSYKEQKEFHKKVWIFTHGIACLVATKTIKINDKEIEELLSTTVTEMLEGFKNKKK